MDVTTLEIMMARGLSYFLGTVVLTEVATAPAPAATSSSSPGSTSRNSLPSSVAESSIVITYPLCLSTMALPSSLSSPCSLQMVRSAD